MVQRYYSQVILSDNPVAYYQLDETSGTTVADSSPNGNNGTYAGAGVTYGAAGAIAKDSDAAITLNGSSGYFTMPAALDGSGYSALAVEGWFKLSTTSLGSTTFLFAGDNTGSTKGSYSLFWSSNTSLNFQVGNGSATATATYTVAATMNWIHVVGTFDGSNARLYVNGVLQATATLSGSVGSSSNVPVVGASYNHGASYFPGSIDEVAIYNTALQQSQVTTHYNAGQATLQGAYYYGDFQLNANYNKLGYFLVGKDLDFAEFKPQLSPLALYDGYKITGYQVGQRQIQVDIVVVGSSRTDCIARKDTMELYLAKRDQQLILHEDGRYWIANAIKGPAKFAAGKGVVQARIPVVFICANPYAIAADAATPYDSGSIAYTTVVIPGTYQSPLFSVTGGGTIYCWPVITLTHKLATPGSTTLNAALTSGNNYTSLTVVSSPGLSAGQVIKLSWTTGGNTFVQKLTVSSTVTAGATSIPVNSFTASASFPVSSTSVLISTAWNSVTISQLTDNYTLEASSNGNQTYEIVGGNSIAAGTYLLPEAQNDSIIIYCDPTVANGWTIQGSVQGASFTYQPIGAFPPLEPTTTQWQVSIASDYQPTVDFKVQWTPRYTS